MHFRSTLPPRQAIPHFRACAPRKNFRDHVGSRSTGSILRFSVPLTAAEFLDMRRIEEGSA
jgi:hypothetical protein